ncbi:ABC transporter ATP-binding protein [Nocardia alni]|uniref:ABC transporter ATP-binding protein n=1 Tax=Nocardia alni TaxID=2815723 RepID=UPI001C248716|nr:ABC transporter ATP-binding protein [Nocardia alni]
MGEGKRIVVDHVVHGFGGRRVLDDITFDVDGHELVCIVGQSGCGKTTLLRIMAGLLRCDSGAVLLDGRAVTAPSERTAMVFQHFGLFPWKTVRANIEYGLRNRGVRDPQRVDRLIETIGLKGAEDRYPRQLSGGMQQRVGLARALAVEPEVLLMDEPFGALDAITREQLHDELLRIWAENRSITGIFITHDIDEAIVLGDRIIVMAGGVAAHIIDVPIPRPRTAQDARVHPGYPELRRKVRKALQFG